LKPFPLYLSFFDGFNSFILLIHKDNSSLFLPLPTNVTFPSEPSIFVSIPSGISTSILLLYPIFKDKPFFSSPSLFLIVASRIPKPTPCKLR